MTDDTLVMGCLLLAVTMACAAAVVLVLLVLR